MEEVTIVVTAIAVTNFEVPDLREGLFFHQTLLRQALG
jgi:hypothetical protein